MKIAETINIRGEEQHLMACRHLGSWLVAYAPMIDAGEGSFTMGAASYYQIDDCVLKALKKLKDLTTKPKQKTDDGTIPNGNSGV